MKETIIKAILAGVIDNALEVKTTYEDLTNDHGASSIINHLYDECSREIIVIETYCKLIGKLISANDSEYDLLNNAFRFTINTEYGYREDYVRLDKLNLTYYLKVRLD